MGFHSQSRRSDATEDWLVPKVREDRTKVVWET